MNMNGLLKSLALAAVMGLTVASAQAEVGVSGSGGIIQPGQVRNLALNLDFGAGANVTTFQLDIEFDSVFLKLRPDLSAVVVGGQERSFQQFFTDDLGLGFNPLHNEGDTDPGYFGYSFYSPSAFLPLAGPVIIKPAFEMLLAPAGNTPVPISVGVFLTDDSSSVIADVEGLQLLANPVPEPQEWALWMTGLGLLAWRGLARKA